MQKKENLKSEDDFIVQFLTFDHNKNKLTWSDEKIVCKQSINSLSSSQIKRIVKFKDKKIIFLGGKYYIGVIAICVFDK